MALSKTGALDMNMFVLALRNVLRNRRRSIATIAAVAMGLAAVNLFGGYISNVYKGLQTQAVSGERLGHLTIYKTGMLLEGKLRPNKYMFSAEEGRDVSKIIRDSGHVKLVSPRISISGLASNGQISSIFIGEGIVPEHAEALREGLEEGVGGRLMPGRSYGISVSSDLARLLGYKVGDTITLLSSTLDGQANALDAEIVNVFNTGNAGTNDKYMVASLSFSQILLDTDKVEKFVVLFDDEKLTLGKREELQAKLKAAGYDVEIKTWQELSSFYLQVRNLFNMIFSFIAVIVFVIAVMSIANTIAMTVVERTREIGTMRSIGMRTGGVVKLFAYESAWLAIVGTGLGALVTFAVAMIVNHAGITYTPPNSSYAVALLVDLEWPQITAVASVVILLSILSAVLPSLKAGRLKIVDALAHT
jgi:putative ABC transport system permease protein